MTDNDTPQTGDSIDAPEPLVEKVRGFSLIWLIPIVAILVGGGIGIDTIRNRGVHAVITLPTAEWIEPGKTKIRYLNIDVGTVDAVHMNKKGDGVELHCTLIKASKKYLNEGANFWLVYPRVGAGGISGLGTLVSGAYLSIQLGPTDAEPKRLFKALETAPLESDISPGLTIQLHTEELNSLDVGSPVYFRQIQVGKVERHSLEKDGSGVVVRVFFAPEYAGLVREDSRFWNAGGIQVSGSLAHLEVEAESLDSIIAGGIAFDTPSGEKAGPATKDSKFWLHSSKADVKTYPFRYGGLRIYVEGPELGSIAIGDEVYYREIPVGAVITKELLNDSRHVRIGLNIQQRYASLVRSNSVFWNASGISASLGLSGLEIHTGSIASILAGGIGFATPNSPGHEVKPGSVFQMHDEVKDAWLEWSPLIWRGAPGEAPPEANQKSAEGKGSRIAHFFHHKNKDEAESQKAGEPNKDSTQNGAHEEKRHGFFHNLFHKKDKAADDKD